ncbi:Fic family protein [uncultured Draconibacterium sp.]|uniref:Fic family protein n=1 Tax=uncultured Draconibacterium sp. TaxID=1573823 RepID=UPI0025D585ED|nr:Fic family protein [uncultured Draconibacterium sp.]
MKSFKSGKHISQGHYKSFQPNDINKEWQVNDMQLLNLLSKADRSLGRLDMYSEYVNIDLFIRMHIAKEATQSSRIEGTQTNMEDAFLEKKDVAVEKRDDWEEVQNYISAMNEAVKLLHTLPFSSRLIRQTHNILLKGVRGTNKNPGEYRRSQNWIGGASINDATFIPPVHSTVPELMSDIEFFANNELNPLPELLKIGIIHYQFETIHPFLDGNGRVGRLLITLYLVNKGILKQPILYLSDFFERNRTLYYDNLMRVRTHNDIDQWLKFFLTGVIEISKKGVETFDKIMQLQKVLDSKIQTLGSRGNEARKVIDHLYSQPVIDAMRIAMITNKSKATNYKLLDDLENMGILKEITGAQRNKLYVFNDYLELFSS